MADNRKPSRKEKRQQDVDDVVGFLGSGRGMWFVVGLGAIGLISAVSMVITAFSS